MRDDIKDGCVQTNILYKIRNKKRIDLSVIVRKNRAIAKDRGLPFTFMFSKYESYLKRLTTMAFGEVAVRFSSRYHYFEILGPPAT